MRDPVRVGARDPDAEHAAKRMRHDVGLGYSEMIEQRDRVARQRIEMQVALRLGGFAEADLVRHHHAIAGVAQRLDHRCPVARWEIAAMQQHHRAPVRLRGSYVHIGHPHLFAVVHQRQQMDGVGIGETFERDAIRFARCGSFSFRCGRRQQRRRRQGGHYRTNAHPSHPKTPVLKTGAY